MCLLREAYGCNVIKLQQSRKSGRVIVDGDKIRLARKRETIDDLLNGEIII